MIYLKNLRLPREGLLDRAPLDKLEYELYNNKIEHTLSESIHDRVYRMLEEDTEEITYNREINVQLRDETSK